MSDFTLGDTIYHKFTTRAFATGVPTALAGSPTLEIYENDSATPIVEGAGKLVLTQNLNSINGYNLATITATSGNGFEAGKSYSLMLKTGTVGGTSVVGEAIWEFTLQASAAAVDLANGTDGLGAIKTDTAAIKTMTDKVGTVTNTGGTATLGAILGDFANTTLTGRLLAAGAQMDLVNAPNGTAVTAIQNGLATGTNLATVDTVVDLIEDIVRNKLAVTNATGAATLYADDSTTPLLTCTVTDDSTTTTRTRLA